MIFSTSKQRQLIGFFRKTLKLQEDIYRAILAGYNVESSKQLTYEEAQELLNNLREKAIGLKLYTPRQYKSKYDNMAGRFGYGTPKELRYMLYLWSQVTNQTNEKDKEIALNHFAKKITGCEHIKFLTHQDITKVIKAIREMIERQEKACSA